MIVAEIIISSQHVPYSMEQVPVIFQIKPGLNFLENGPVLQWSRMTGISSYISTSISQPRLLGYIAPNAYMDWPWLLASSRNSASIGWVLPFVVYSIYQQASG